MAQISSFKNGSMRIMTTEGGFKGGVRYTTQPQAEGYAKKIVNMVYKNSESALTPRPAYRRTTVLPAVTADYNVPYTSSTRIHHTGMLLVKTYDGTDTVSCYYSMQGFVHSPATDGAIYMRLHDAVLVIQHNGHYYNAKYQSDNVNALDGVCIMNKIPQFTALDKGDMSASGVFASIQGNTYLPVRGESSCVGRIVATLNEAQNSFSWYVEKLTPQDINITQAVNYGYNMLKPTPYEFSNTVTSTGGIVLDGILPKDTTGKVVMTARAGTTLAFNLVYQYPTEDITGDKYLVQWELQDLTSTSDPIVLQQVRKSPQYVPGTAIYLRTSKTTYKRFALTAKIYKKSVVDATVIPSNLTQEIGDDLYLTPDQVITVTFETLQNDSTNTLLNMEPVAYDLTTATGMCAWGTRLVLWGVKNATSCLFVSEINAPNYVPYPNNSEIFPDEIIACVPYQTNLLVFTKSKLYLCRFNADGLTYTVKCIQERLTMESTDAATILQVQNMVYFKSGDYFFMVVPNTNTATTGELQLAPVSNPINNWIDGFDTNLKTLLKDVYSVRINEVHDIYNPTMLLDYKAYNVYLDGNAIKNSFLFGINFGSMYREFICNLNYNVASRTWLFEIVEVGFDGDIKPFISSITRETIYIYTQSSSPTTKTVINTELITQDSSAVNILDSITLPFANTFCNYQYIESGYRDSDTETKKRFREIQFKVNNTHGTSVVIHPGFIVDDEVRRPVTNTFIEQDDDVNSPTFGNLIISQEYDAIETTNDVVKDGCTLDFSRFAPVSLVKVRYKVSGKGYGGSVMLLFTSNTQFELLNMSWVYKSMFAR